MWVCVDFLIVVMVLFVDLRFGVGVLRYCWFSCLFVIYVVFCWLMLLFIGVRFLVLSWFCVWF